jgi:hypothetical protein
MKSTMSNKPAVRHPTPNFDEAVGFAVLNVPLPSGAAVFGLIEDVVDELPSLRPLRALLLVSIAVRPVAFALVEFVEELRPETKLTTAHLKFQPALRLKGLQITNLVNLHHTRMFCKLDRSAQGRARRTVQFPLRSLLGTGLSN